jgi:hypothetical protein
MQLFCEYAVVQLFEALRYKLEGRGIDSCWGNWICVYITEYGPGVESASNRNEYQEFFLGDKGGWCVGLTTLPALCAVVLKSGNLSFLEPSGPVQACNGAVYF